MPGVASTEFRTSFSALLFFSVQNSSQQMVHRNAPNLQLYGVFFLEGSRSHVEVEQKLMFIRRISETKTRRTDIRKKLRIETTAPFLLENGIIENVIFHKLK